ncbi:MAG: CvpA family protein [Candidatus Electryoneaceae bacterium]|nr:CvpA family protein [Candidatus Electryoneaceae bacterium]
MTTYDIIIFIFVGLFIFWGTYRGFIRGMISLVGLVLGFILAVKFAPAFAPFIPGELYPAIKMSIAGAVIVIGTMISVRMLGWFVRKAVVHGPIKIVDKIVGGLVGGLKGFVIILVVVTAVSFTSYSEKLEQASQQSSSIPLLKHAMTSAKWIAQHVGTMFVASITDRIMEIMPAADRNLSPDMITQILNRADSMKSLGLSRDQILNLLPNDLPIKSWNQAPEVSILQDVLDQADNLASYGLPTDQVREILTEQELQIEPEAIREIIGQVQQFRMSGQQLGKKEFVNSLSDETRQQIERITHNPAFRNAISNMDRSEFTARTGFNLDDLAEQFGMDDLLERVNRNRRN